MSYYTNSNSKLILDPTFYTKEFFSLINNVISWFIFIKFIDI